MTVLPFMVSVYKHHAHVGGTRTKKDPSGWIQREQIK